jgi:hypothetical protein
MSRANNSHEKNKKPHTATLRWENLKGRDHLEDQEVDGRLLKHMSDTYELDGSSL